MLPKQNRLRKKSDFSQVLNFGKKISSQYFNAFLLSDTDKDGSQFGVIVSNKVSKSAVERNRIKRTIRNFLHKNISLSMCGKVVVIAKGAANSANRSHLLSDLEEMFSKY